MNFKFSVLTPFDTLWQTFTTFHNLWLFVLFSSTLTTLLDYSLRQAGKQASKSFNHSTFQPFMRAYRFLLYYFISLLLYYFITLLHAQTLWQGQGQAVMQSSSQAVKKLNTDWYFSHRITRRQAGKQFSIISHFFNIISLFTTLTCLDSAYNLWNQHLFNTWSTLFMLSLELKFTCLFLILIRFSQTVRQTGRQAVLLKQS